MPWSAILSLGVLRCVGLAVGVLLLRRLPVVMALSPMVPALRDVRETLFTGWFGPMGVGAIFFAAVVQERLADGGLTISGLVPVVYLIVLSSVIVHGITVPMVALHMKRQRGPTRDGPNKT